MLDFGALPPEINSGRMYVGAGSGPMLAAAAAWDSLAAELQSTAASYGSTIESLSVGPWTGPSSIAMAAAATPYVAWINATGAQAEQAASQAKIAAGAYDAIVLAVAHEQFTELGAEAIRAFGGPGSVLFDVKSVLPQGAADLRL